MTAAPLLLDLTRLLQRSSLGRPSGVDRVEFAYAEHLHHRAADRLTFVAVDKLGRLLFLPHALTIGFLRDTAAAWQCGAPSAGHLATRADRLLQHASLVRPHGGGARPFYLIIAHQHLHKRARLDRVLTATNGRLVTFIHDLIPIQFPEYARPGHAERHTARIETATGLADAIIVNSAATGAALAPYLAASGRKPEVVVAHLGTSRLPARAGRGGAPGVPFFVCISTIEPRKNHLTLLHVWRRLAERHGDRTPRLVLVGRRGWENENVVDLLERSPLIRRFVTENPATTDAELADLLGGCRALLFPSFAEGFGMPVAEALAAGTPVICSDLPVLREVAGDAPTYLDPIDGTAWLDAVEAAMRSPRPVFECPRAVTWEDHFDAVMPYLEAG